MAGRGQVAKLFQKLDSVTAINPLAASKEGWSDSFVFGIAKSHPLYPASSSSDDVAEIAREWFNFYFLGYHANTQTVMDVVARAMSLACIPVGTNSLVSIWKYTSDHPKWYRFDTVSQGNLAESHRITNVTLDPDYVKLLLKSSDQEDLKSRIRYGDDENNRSFRDMFQDLIERTKKGELPARLTLCNIVAFSAAVTLRAMAKDRNQMAASYLKKNYQENIRKVSHSSELFTMPGPCQTFVTKVNTSITKGHRYAQTLLCHCLAVFADPKMVDTQGSSYEDAQTFVKASNLTHLEHNGLAVASLFSRCMKELPATAAQLAEHLTCDALVPSLTCIGKAFTKYIVQDKCKTWWWARAYDDAYLPEFAKGTHSLMVAVLSHLLYKKSPHSNALILSSYAIVNLSEEDKLEAQYFAEAIYEAKYSFKVVIEDKEIRDSYNKIKRETRSTTKEPDHQNITQAQVDDLIEQFKKNSKSRENEDKNRPVVGKEPTIPADIKEAGVITLGHSTVVDKALASMSQVFFQDAQHPIHRYERDPDTGSIKTLAKGRYQTSMHSSLADIRSLLSGSSSENGDDGENEADTDEESVHEDE